MDERIYVIFRVYKDEPKRNHVYGWCEIKEIGKAFMKQRTPGKYKMVKMTSEDLAKYFSESSMELSNQIDRYMIDSVHSSDPITFFSTADEMKEAEANIQRYFRELPQLIERADGRSEVVELFIHLKEKYAIALDYLGFRPPEVEAIYDRDDWVGDADETSIEGIVDTIDNAYTEKVIEEYKSGRSVNRYPAGLDYLRDEYAKMILTLESFVIVLKEEL